MSGFYAPHPLSRQHVRKQHRRGHTWRTRGTEAEHAAARALMAARKS